MNPEQYQVWKEKMKEMIRPYCESDEEFNYIVDFMSHLKGKYEYQLLVEYHPKIKTVEEADKFLDLASEGMFYYNEDNPVAESLNARVWIYLPLLKQKFKNE